MTNKFWEDAKCSFCSTKTEFFCDACNKAICEDRHCIKLRIRHESGYRTEASAGETKIHTCHECIKKVKEGMVIGGIRITSKIIEQVPKKYLEETKKE